MGKIDKDTMIPKFFAVLDMDNNILHVMPFALDSSFQENYRYPYKITESGEHNYFASGLGNLQLILRNLRFVCYGIDASKCEPEISVFGYDVEKDALSLDEHAVKIVDMLVPLILTLQKEVLFLKNSEK